MRRVATLALIVGLSSASSLFAQAGSAERPAAAPPVIGPGSTPDVQVTETAVAPPDSNKASLLVAPIPFYNSQLGAGLVGMVGVLKRLGDEPTIPTRPAPSCEL